MSTTRQWTRTRQSKDVRYDVIVAGGRLAGVAAATAAARTGAEPLLVERQPFAGGVSTASMEPCLCNFFHNTRQELIVRGRPLELVERDGCLPDARHPMEQNARHQHGFLHAVSPLSCRRHARFGTPYAIAQRV